MEEILRFILLDLEIFPAIGLQILKIMLVIMCAKALSGLLARGFKRPFKIDSGATYSITQLIS
jgi:hypothetical protein